MTRTLRAPLLLLLTAALLLGTLATRPAPATGAASLNGHAVRLDSGGKLLPWNGASDTAYAGVTSLAWKYLLTAVPDDPATDQPAYLSRSYLDPDSQKVVGWPHNPAGLYATLIESALRTYDFTGDKRTLALARRVADQQLATGMTSTQDAWSHVPYASGESGSLTYRGAEVGDDPDKLGSGDGVGVIEPDKVGELGHGFVQLYELTGDKTYLAAALDAADALVANRHPGDANHSLWPFRVQAADDVSREPYTASVTGPLELFDDLIALKQGDVAGYQAARKALWSWTMTYPVKTNNWSQYFEDVETHQAPDDNLNQLDAMMFARYLLEHPSTDAQWEKHVRGLIAWVEKTFGRTQQGGALTINEQQAFFHPMGSHTARYAAVNALLYQRTGDKTAAAKAFRSFNWATYMARTNGVVIDGPEVGDGGNQWFTDGYGDYVRHFLVGMAAMPQYAPNGQTHVLDSTTVVKKVAYGARSLAYTTFAPAGTERIKTATVPTAVAVNGKALPRGTKAGSWAYSTGLHLLIVRRAAGTSVSVALPKGTGVR